jgi:hypothetical protein
MVAHVKPAGKDSLRITFSRKGKGESDELRIADNGSCAVSMAMRILAVKDTLLPGDTLTIAENRPAAVLSGEPPVRFDDD